MQSMESWVLGGSERVSFGISDGVLPPFDSTSMTKEALSEWEMGISCNPNNSVSHTSMHGVIENPTFLDSSVCAAHDSISEGLERGFIEHMSKEHEVILGSLVSTKADEGEKEEGSKASSSIVDPDAQDPSLIDLKLGRLSEWMSPENSKSSKIMGNFLTQKSVNTAKRTPSSGANGKAPLCQVHGCNMDLSSFKDYYKRHKVCLVHSKTAKVIVNGIQQRFCQQCSRFHLISEFDDGKRSCRKRLAGHNERRRKPQIVFQSGKSGMVLPYYGSNFLGTPLSDGILHNGNCESVDWSRLAGVNTSSTSMQMQTSTFHMHTNSAVPRGMEKEISFANGNATVPGSTFSVYASQYGSGISASNLIFDAGDSVKDFTGVLDSKRARSLLSSSQQANLYVYPSTIPVTPLSNVHNNDASESKLRIPDRAELALQGSSNTTLSFGVDTPGYSQSTFMRNEIKSFGDLESQMRKHFHGSHFGGTGSAVSHEHGQTTDLLQPSPLPQDAESRKRSLQVRQPFGSLPIS